MSLLSPVRIQIPTALLLVIVLLVILRKKTDEPEPEVLFV